MITIIPATPLLAREYAEANSQPMVGWRNVLAEGTLENAGGTGNMRENALEENTVDYWNVGVGNTLRTTYFTTRVADFCFIAAHDLAGSEFRVQRYNGSSWSTVATVTPATNDPFMVLFPRENREGWGIQAETGRNIGVAWIGPRTIIPGGVVPGYAPVWASRMVNKWGGGTRRGHWLGQRVDSVTARLNAQFMPIPLSFVQAGMREFGDRYNDGRAFVWASAPGVFTDDVAYCWAEEGAMFSPTPLAGGELCDLSLTMTAYCEP